jgi:hypothetical protein
MSNQMKTVTTEEAAKMIAARNSNDTPTDSRDPREKPLEIAIGPHRKFALPKVFSTGSDGFYMSDKIEIPGIVKPNGNPERYQVSLNITRIGSKPK